MKHKTVYYDALRGPLAVKPIEFIEGDSLAGPSVRCKVTARNTHSGYRTGDIIQCKPDSLVRLRSGMRCYSIGTDEIKRIIR